MQYFIIGLKPAKKSTHLTVSMFIFLMHALVWGFLLTRAIFYSGYLITGVIVSILSFLALIFPVLSKSHRASLVTIAMSVLCLLWLLMGHIMPGLILLAVAVMSFYASRKLKMIVNNDGIEYPSFPPRNIAWREVQQLMVKDDILTLDLKNNQVFQQQLDAEASLNLDVDLFNRFCREKIAAHRKTD